MRTMHLFAGAGGGLLSDLILGHRPICAVEWDPYACAVLRERAADGWFPNLCVHEGDVRLFDPSEYAGRVDCIHAGFPCQDISVAGSGAGINGERSGLFREAIRIANVVRPRFLFLENSPAIVVRGLGIVLGCLAARGYDARWTVLAAADVGAPHKRERWWCLAERADSHGEPTGTGESERQEAWEKTGMVGKSDASHADRYQRPSGHAIDGRRIKQRPPAAADGGIDVANASSDGSQDAISRRVAGAGNGRTVEAAAGCDRRPGWWELEPDVGRVANGVASRVDRLKSIGNGQVSLCAAAAWRILGGPVT